MTAMLEQELYVRAKLDDLRRYTVVRDEPRVVDEGAEVPRTGVGVRHEVFRRIAGDRQPERAPLWRRIVFAR